MLAVKAPRVATWLVPSIVAEPAAPVRVEAMIEPVSVMAPALRVMVLPASVPLRERVPVVVIDRSRLSGAVAVRGSAPAPARTMPVSCRPV